MISLQHHSDILSTSFFFGLLLRCPFVEGRNSDCPLRQYHTDGSPEETFQLAEQMSKTMKLKVIARHHHCLQTRLSALRIPFFRGKKNRKENDNASLG
ncbi:MAG: hypothetical protein KJ950_06545 [Proteobacteria bacterium]|nr:hypothetical protein [Pseudomonadota bacterium]MBU1687192.1 hypothetical protein [Pseudomonadota bacterium]